MPEFSLTGTLRIEPSWVDGLGVSEALDSTAIAVPLVFANGTTAGRANAYWRDVRTVNGSALDIINPADLPKTVFGGSGSLSMSSIKLIYVRNLSASVTIRYRVYESNRDLPPGAVFLWTAGTTPSIKWLDDDDQITVTGGSATAAYEIMLVGVI